MSFDYFIVVCIAILAPTVITAALLEGSSRRICKIIAVVSFVIALLTTVVFLVFNILFSPMTTLAERVYEDPKIISSTEIQLTALDNTEYYLVRGGEEYRYYSQDESNDEQPLKVETSQCQIEYSSSTPTLTIEKASKNWHREWLFLYEDGTGTETKYIFTIPSKDSILDLDNP